MEPEDVVLDPTIVPLVRSLHAFGGIRTLGSAGRPAQASARQTGAGAWSVLFQVAPTAAGWFALEFLAWLINHEGRPPDQHLLLYPTAPPPHHHQPGACLRFVLTGEGIAPDAVATAMDQARRAHYLPPEAVLTGEAHTLLAPQDRAQLRPWITSEVLARKDINVVEVTRQAMERFGVPAECEREVEDYVCTVIAETLAASLA